MGQPEKITLPCDKRYRTCKYFLDDQLRASEAVEDFRSMKSLLDSTPSFTLRHAFRFQTQAVFVRSSR